MSKPLIGDTETFVAFRHLNFRRFIFSKFMLTLALQIQFVVLSWQVYEILHDPLSLGSGLAEAIPAVGLALYGGYISDRSDRRKICLGAGFINRLFCTFAYISFHFSSLPLEQQHAFPFYMIMFGVGVLRGFYSPAQFPLMTQLVPREAYANSSAWNSTFLAYRCCSWFIRRWIAAWILWKEHVVFWLYW